jgi:hypothetical protein
LRPASKALSAALLLALAACGESEAPPASPAKEKASGPTAAAWSFRSNDMGGQAHWGPPEGDSAFWVGCDPAAKAVVLRRAGGSGSELGLRAGVAEARYPATVEGGALVARAPLADPALEGLAGATGPLTVTGGGDPLTTGALTGAFGRVIRACRRLTSEDAPAPGAAGAPGERVVVHDCVDGNSVTARYPDDVTVQVTQGSKTYRMTQAPAPTGTRYVGDGRQWWVQGRGRAAAGRLAELPEGQTTTTDLGLLCKVRTGVG